MYDQFDGDIGWHMQMSEAVTAPQRIVQPAFFSFRTALGLLAGITAWLVFAIFYNKPLDNSPLISILLIMQISGSFRPKRLTGLAALTGFMAGIFWGIKYFLENMGDGDLSTLIVLYLVIILIIGSFSFAFAVYGFIIGTMAKLARRGAIF
jgi:hypothetical protein